MGTKHKHTYTEQDVRAYYGDYANELSPEQIQAIAYTWGVIDTVVDQSYGLPCPGEDFNDIKNDFASRVARIIDGSDTVENLEHRAFIAMAEYSDIQMELHFAKIAQEKLNELI